MAKQTLTDAAVRKKADAGGRSELWDSHTRGLCLRIGGATKTWLVRYRVDGKQRRYSFGAYPAMGVGDARLEAARVLAEVKRGGADPIADKQRLKAEAKAQPIKTFGQLAAAYMAACRAGEWKPRGKPQSPRTIKDAGESLGRYILPVLGDLPLKDVTRAVIRDFLRTLSRRGIKAQANKAMAVVRQIYAFGLLEYEGRLVAENPAVNHPREEELPRTRVLTDAELKALWRALSQPGGVTLHPPANGASGRPVRLSRPMAILLQLAILTLQRRNELAGMMASEVDLDRGTWLIPGPRMKGRKPHLVPLSAPAVALIREAMELPCAYHDGAAPNDLPVFPSPRDLTKPITPAAVSHALNPVMKALGIAGASVHDLRRTGSTLLTSERLGVSGFIRSLVIAHATDTGGGALVSSRHYDANSYLPEKRRALDAWAVLVMEIGEGRERESNVRPIRTVGS